MTVISVPSLGGEAEGASTRYSLVGNAEMTSVSWSEPVTNLSSAAELAS
jgi:hypothetical protein